MDANEENNINNEIEINNNDNNEQVSENKEHHHHGSVCNHSHAPRRRIFSVEDMNEFLESDTKKNLLDFIKRLNEQIIGVSNKKEVKPSNTIEKIIKLLDSFRELIKNTPPHPTRSRYGNSAFKDWFEKMENSSKELQKDFVSEEKMEEVNEYLTHSFGNKDRIDFGTGHEAHFISWLYCLELLNVINADDYLAIILLVFRKYMELMRELQLTYWLEPAGSHGIWGLDDYHFLPFLFGSAQLIGHKYIQPRSIRDKEFVEDFATEYMYVDCIKFINSVKTESLPWHSPMLYDISGVKTWNKVNEGMIKMYDKEVLSKLPVMQHFLFGSFLNFVPTSLEKADEEYLKQLEEKAAQLDHYHDPSNICCNIKVPSVFGIQENRIPIPLD